MLTQLCSNSTVAERSLGAGSTSQRACLVLGACSPVRGVIAAVAHWVAHGLVGVLYRQQAALSALPQHADATAASHAERGAQVRAVV